MGLDTVELVMAFEEEFSIDIPNAVAEDMVSAGKAAEAIAAILARLGRPADAQAVYARVKAITCDQLNIDPARIGWDTRFVEDIGAD